MERLSGVPSSQGCATRPGSATSRRDAVRQVRRDQCVLGASAVVRLGDPASRPVRNGRIRGEGRHDGNRGRREGQGGAALAGRDAHRGWPTAKQSLAAALDLGGEMLQGAAGLRRGRPDGIGGLDAAHECGTRIVIGSHAHRLDAGDRRQSRVPATQQLDPGTAGQIFDQAAQHQVRFAEQARRDQRACHPSAGDVLVDEDLHASTAQAASSRIIRSIAS